MKLVNKLATAVACMGLATSALATQGVTDDEIVIGTATALSGPAAVWGVAASQAAQIRYDMVNAEGGVHGRKIRVVLEDHQYQVPLAVKAMNKMLNRDKIFATVNSLGTPQNLAVAERQFAKNVPLLFPLSAAKALQEPTHRLKFTISSSYYDQVRAAVKHFVGEGRSAVCVMHQATDMGAEMLQAATDEVADLGLTIVASAGHKPTDTEFVGTLTGFKGAGCDLIVLGTIIRDTIIGYATARKLGIAADIVVVQPGLDNIVAGYKGGITQGLYAMGLTGAVYCDSAPATAQAFCDAYVSKYGKDPGVAGQLGYMNADMFIEGLKNAGKDLTVDSLIAGLESITNHQEVFGTVTQSYSADNHLGTRALVLSQVRDGRWVTLGNH